MTRRTEPGARVAREFGRAMQALHLRMAGDPGAASTVGRWSELAWREAEAGHVCVDVPDGTERTALSASPVVDPAMPDATPRPLALDGDALYLHRLWRAETGLARAARALDAPAPVAGGEGIERAVAAVFGHADPADPQQRAVALALERRLVILSGGPGTGKTTTLARLLVAFARAVPDARVAYAAPTGKAAARLAQSLGTQLAALDPAGTLRARLPATGLTVHRLLGPDGAGARRLDRDLVIVDEASMLDIELAARLFASIGPSTRLVLAGDRDQLASVEAGAVFADLCAAPLGGVVALARNFRQRDAPDIATLAARIREASAGGVGPIDWPAPIPLASPSAAAIAAAALEAWSRALAEAAAGAPAARVLVAYEQHRILAAMRDGPCGVDALNAIVAARVRRRVPGPAVGDWYPGRLAMVTRNEPGLGLFNGDVGVCLRDAGAGERELMVAFDGPQGVRRFPVLQMPACQDAWAMTVHKAQGSEFESVALVPAPAGHALNTRELVYTGVTRARRHLCVWGTRAAIEEAARRPTRRRGRLSSRLAGLEPESESELGAGVAPASPDAPGGE